MVEVVELTPRHVSERTKVWYGSTGSGDKLMKNAQKRDELRNKFNLIGLEMEAAGTINTIPVGVIQGSATTEILRRTKNGIYMQRLWLLHMLKHFSTRSNRRT